MTDWLDPLPPDERDILIDRVAKEVTRRGMALPAILFLEMHKPISLLASHGLIVSAPLIAPIAGLENLQGATRLLHDRANVERLIQRIEERAQESTPGDKGANRADSQGPAPRAKRPPTSAEGPPNGPGEA